MPRRIRLSAEQRGYGGEYVRAKEHARPFVRAGLVVCPYCGERIKPAGEAWDLGHSDDRSFLIGPCHARCNRSEAGLKSARLRRGEPRVTSRQW